MTKALSSTHVRGSSWRFRLAAGALALAAALASGVIGPVPGAQAAAQATFYVATTGSDANGDGSATAPWATVQKARDHIRSNSLNANMTGDIDVLVAAGTYYQDSTIAFNDTDSGSNGFNVVYKNRDAVGSARLVGGQAVTGWTQHQGNIYKANVGTDWDFETLYENGKRAVKARYPNRNLLASTTAAADYLTSANSVDGMRTVINYKPGDLDPSGWNISGAQAYIWSGDHWDWFTDTVPISSIDTATRAIALSQNTRYPIYQSSFHRGGSRYYIQGVLALLDQPGEFYLDQADGYLYYYAMDGAIQNQTVVAPTTQRVVSFIGASETARVHNLQFEGLSIEVSDFTPWYRHAHVAAGDSGEPHTYSQYDRQINMPQHRTGMLYLENTDHVSIRNNHFSNSGYSAIYMLFYNQNNSIYGNLIENAGHSGVYVEGRYPGEGDVSKNNVISNNVIHDVGQLVGNGAGVALANSGGNEVSYSEIYNSPRYAVEFKAYVNIPNSAIYARNNRIKNLKIHACAQDSGDTSPLYSWGVSTTTAPYNINTMDQITIDDTYAHLSMLDYSPNGVFLDGGTHHQAMSNIKVTRVQGAAWRTNSGGHTFANVSWGGGFDDSKMDYANIGTKSDFPYPTAPPPLFTDGFETGFGAWTNAKGTATASSTTAHTGTQSYGAGQAASVITHPLPSSLNKQATVWFYDDATDTSAQVFAKVDNTGWNSATWRGIGVATPTSPTNYVTRVDGTLTATSVARTTGWHAFTFDYTSGKRVDMYIDGTLVGSSTGITTFNSISLGNWWTSSLASTTYFDDVTIGNKSTYLDESFEYGTASWALGYGALTPSTAKSHSGSRSYTPGQDRGVITQKTAARPSKVTIWFYDDASNTAGPVFTKVDNAAWNDGTKWRGIGISPTVSATTYVTRVDGLVSATAITRTTGWHALTFDYTSGTHMDMAIDGTVVASPTGITSFTGISVGDWWPDSKTTASYFDDITITQ